MSARAFTPEQESEILAMRAIGIPTGEIVAEYGHRNAVYSLFARENVARQPTGPTARLLSPAEATAIATLHDDGYAVTAIARRTGRSPETVARVLSRLNDR